jgi:hypothetical protein
MGHSQGERNEEFYALAAAVKRAGEQPPVRQGSLPASDDKGAVARV